MQIKSEKLQNINLKFIHFIQGKKPDIAEIEDKLLEFIALNLNAKNPLTIWTIVNYWDKNYPEKAKDSFNTKNIRIYRFIKKHGFTVRKPTKQGHLYILKIILKL